MATRKCYWPNGLEADGVEVCDPDKDESVCCWSQGKSMCMSNKLCMWLLDWQMDRVACTDKTWQSDACPKICMDKAIDYDHADITFQICDDSAAFCCDTAHECCNDTSWRAEIGLVVPTAFGDIYFPGERAQATASSATGSGATTVTSLIGSATEGSSPNGAVASGECKSCSATAVGIGLGVPLALCLVALTALLWSIFRRRRREREQNNQMGVARRYPQPGQDITAADSAMWANQSTPTPVMSTSSQPAFVGQGQGRGLSEMSNWERQQSPSELDAGKPGSATDARQGYA